MIRWYVRWSPLSPKPGKSVCVAARLRHALPYTLPLKTKPWVHGESIVVVIVVVVNAMIYYRLAWSMVT